MAENKSDGVADPVISNDNITEAETLIARALVHFMGYLATPSINGKLLPLSEEVPGRYSETTGERVSVRCIHTLTGDSNPRNLDIWFNSKKNAEMGKSYVFNGLHCFRYTTYSQLVNAIEKALKFSTLSS
ncbi:MAG: hypothetical protein Edafosvirus5_36 [Edafosvirus sp.]|uniref:Uncharacterized protein n=1 Tax=Edafosvirus sp. TaxID=2487765 RepID=A0A3G4ZTA8_9VIRU|nr:MAG: hypothetical protein Edafosvirus5_36 [Edafosvirus sp.]